MAVLITVIVIVGAVIAGVAYLFYLTSGSHDQKG
jgi:hypothetical protein